jgi:hypothetical protein
MYGGFTVRPKNQPAPQEPAFFGLTSANQSLKWIAAEGSLDPGNFQFKARCRITAYPNLSVWTTQLGISAGQLKAEAILDQSGAGENGDAKFRILNSDSSGIVRADEIEVEFTLSRPDWAAEIKRQLANNNATTLQLNCTVNNAIHDAGLNLNANQTKLRLEP